MIEKSSGFLVLKYFLRIDTNYFLSICLITHKYKCTSVFWSHRLTDSTECKIPLLLGSSKDFDSLLSFNKGELGLLSSAN